MIRNETIVALATPLGTAPLAIIRVSGSKAIEITNSLFNGTQSLLEAQGNSIVFGYIIDPKTNERVDQVLVSVFTDPKSFTGENMVEISCHGGLVIFQKIIDLLLDQGAKLAKPGEFTQRAFFNQKMDLTQAESIHDLIFSKSSKANQLIVENLRKNFTRKMMDLKQTILNLVAKIEVGIDYPEEDLEIWNAQDQTNLEALLSEVNQLIKQAQKSQHLYHGYKVALIGKPNAGKSSLLNLIMGEEKAIVSSIAGTTRDPIEAVLNLNGVPLTLIDTAGVRENPENEIEAIGIQKTETAYLTADFVILMHDILDTDLKETLTIIDKMRTESIPFVVLFNKVDLMKPNEYPKLLDSSVSQLFFSCKDNSHLENLLTILEGSLQVMGEGEIQFFINLRQQKLLNEIEYLLRETKDLYEQGDSLELLSFSLQKVLHTIAEIDGSDIKEDILDTIFSTFCVGK